MNASDAVFNLSFIRGVDAHDGYRVLFDYLRSRWSYGEIEVRAIDGDKVMTGEGVEVRLTTGGWSENEAVIGAMRENVGFWSLCWYSSHVNGEHVFRIPRAFWEGI